MKEPVKNIPASILARLKNQTELMERPFAEVLQYYAMERFLYRLSQTRYADKFILKGGLLFYVWNLPLLISNHLFSICYDERIPRHLLHEQRNISSRPIILSVDRESIEYTETTRSFSRWLHPSLRHPIPGLFVRCGLSWQRRQCRHFAPYSENCSLARW